MRGQHRVIGADLGVQCYEPLRFSGGASDPPERRPSELPRCPIYPRTPPRLADTSQHHARDKTQQNVRGSRDENQLTLSQKKKKSERHASQRNQGQDHEADRHNGVRVPLPRAVYKLCPSFMHMYVTSLDGVETLNEK